MSDVIVPVRTYVTVFIALLILTGATTYVATFDFGNFNAVAALTIAVIKASLVALFFMHLRYSGKLIWVMAGAGIFWLGIMLTLSLSDYVTRGWGRL